MNERKKEKKEKKTVQKTHTHTHTHTHKQDDLRSVAQQCCQRKLTKICTRPAFFFSPKQQNVMIQKLQQPEYV